MAFDALAATLVLPPEVRTGAERFEARVRAERNRAVEADTPEEEDELEDEDAAREALDAALGCGSPSAKKRRRREDGEEEERGERPALPPCLRDPPVDDAEGWEGECWFCANDDADGRTPVTREAYRAVVHAWMKNYMRLRLQEAARCVVHEHYTRVVLPAWIRRLRPVPRALRLQEVLVHFTEHPLDPRVHAALSLRMLVQLRKAAFVQGNAKVVCDITKEMRDVYSWKISEMNFLDTAVGAVSAECAESVVRHPLGGLQRRAGVLPDIRDG